MSPPGRDPGAGGTARPGAARATWRRRRLVALVLAGSLVGGGAILWEGSHRRVPLYQEGVLRDPAGALVAVPPGWTHLGWQPLADDRDRRSLDVSVLAARAAADQVWLHSGWVPPTGHPHARMARDALRDLRTLTAPTGAAPGAVLAGASPAWRFVWPRDASFVAAAYARTGHPDDALDVLLHLQRLQSPDGAMQARYLPDGSGQVPDDRLPQEDGPGWALWAARTVVEAWPAGGTGGARDGAGPVTDPAALLTPLITRSTARLLDQLDPTTGLPRPSPDYWERPEDSLTLGIAATSLMGLEAADRLHSSGRVAPAAWAEAGVDPARISPAAQRVREQVVARFGPDFPRHVGGRPDAAVTFLLPPFVEHPVAGAQSARLRAQPAQSRPAGGLAPGAGWRPDGISWTPQTALQALAARWGGRDAEADRWLTWLDQHRTATGALPEKVLHDGRPAAVAPLAWTAALVLLTLTAETAEVAE